MKNNRQELRNLTLYSAGKIISVFGTSMYNFALGLYVLKLTGSALSFAVTLILGILPMILINPFAGAIADKVNKKKLVISADVLSGMVLLTVFTSPMMTLTMIYTTTFLLTVFSTFYGVALESAKPNLVSGERLLSLNSISKIIDSVSAILGPMLGGVVFALFDIRTFILVNGLSFIVSGLSAVWMNFQLFENKTNGKETSIHFIKDIKEGFAYLVKQKGILNLFLVVISINFFLSLAVTVPLPYILNMVLDVGAKRFGFIQGAFPVGMIVGALFVKKLVKNVSYSTLLTGLSYAMALLMISSGLPVLFHMGSAWVVIYYAVVMLLFGMMIAFIDIPLAYFMQVAIPDEYRGRVLSIGLSIGKTMVPLAMIVSGGLLVHLPAYTLPIAGGLLYFLFNLKTSKRFELGGSLDV